MFAVFPVFFSFSLIKDLLENSLHNSSFQRRTSTPVGFPP